MLYRDYSRKPGEWVPNEDGSNHDRDAITFLQDFNRAVYRAYPDVQTIAEESTAWGGVSRPPEHGGLGFGYKWDLGWMHDTLKYLERDPIHRRYHHDELTFRAIYANSENYVLPLSHDEVVHGKGVADRRRCPGDPWQTLRDPAPALRLPVDAAGQEAVVHGRRARRVERVEPRSGARLGDRRCTRRTRASRAGSAISTARTARTARCTSGDCEPGGFRWIVGDDRDASVLASCGTASRPIRRSSSSRTSRRCRATATGSACRAAGSGARSSTPTRRSTAAAGSATAAACDAESVGCRAATNTRSSSPRRLSASSYSCS